MIVQDVNNAEKMARVATEVRNASYPDEANDTPPFRTERSSREETPFVDTCSGRFVVETESFDMSFPPNKGVKTMEILVQPFVQIGETRCENDPDANGIDSDFVDHSSSWGWIPAEALAKRQRWSSRKQGKDRHLSIPVHPRMHRSEER